MPDSTQSRFLHIVHLNDVYNLDMAYKEEPRGGARKFAPQVKAYRQELAGRGFGRLFSRDFVGPSLMSSLTPSEQVSQCEATSNILKITDKNIYISNNLLFLHLLNDFLIYTHFASKVVKQ